MKTKTSTKTCWYVNWLFWFGDYFCEDLIMVAVLRCPVFSVTNINEINFSVSIFFLFLLSFSFFYVDDNGYRSESKVFAYKRDEETLAFSLFCH